MTDLNEWVKKFHQDGFLVIPSVLDKDKCKVLRDNLLEALGGREKKKIIKRQFERSTANRDLFWQEPIVSFAEKLIGETGAPNSKGYEDGIPSANETHVIHNNGFIIPPNTKGLAGSLWHQDDTPHIITHDGKPLTNVTLNVMCFTVNYYLTDVPDLTYGPTQFVKRSHLFGKACPGNVTGYEDKVVTALGPAGTAVMFNNQVWHRGTDNISYQPRYITQVTYAKRLVGHKYGTFMNYQMPTHVYRDIKDDRKLRLLGFLSGGAYG